jgi:putative transposase
MRAALQNPDLSCTRDQARVDVFDYIERFYNPKRRHSTIGY